MSAAHDYARQHASRFQQQLIDLLRIPSVSTLPQHAPDVQRAAEWLIADMQRIGFDRAVIEQQPGYLPLIYGEWLGAGESAPTVLIYCHYDVQPADMADGWDSDPFTPVERDGKIYARGAVDSKSHVIAQLKAIESLLASPGKSPVNIKVLFEGEEESGSEHIFQFVADNPERLQADVCVVSDGSMPAVDQPDLVYGLRGIISLELTVHGPGRDLHSGHYGGNVHNPIQALAEIIAQLHDPNGTVTVPGFYDDVPPISDEERAVLQAALPYAQTEWDAVTGASQPWGESEYTLLERSGARPTLEINGIAGGFYGTGFKTVLPAKATAKISCRLVPNQDPAQTFEQVRDYIQALTPPTVHSEVTSLEEGAPGVLFDRGTPAMRAAAAAYTKGWGVAPIFSRAGGSVPVVAAFQQKLNLPIVMLAFGYKGCGAHGPNEHVYLDMFHKGIATAIHFLQDYPAL
jgi:acetylornithine deacetylase/succinyl-diaminopimelate desuccinylase-like protein